MVSMMRWLDNTFKYDTNKTVSGLTDELSVLYITNYFTKNDNDVVILTNTLYEANNVYKMIKTYLDECLLFPMDDFITSVAVAISPDFKLKRLEVLEKLKDDKKRKNIVVTSLMGYLKYLPNIEDEQKFTIYPSPSNISREIILKKLETFGYTKTSLVTSTGEYAVRGYIIDVFPYQLDYPVRIEFFGNDVEKIKTFNEETQLTEQEISSVEIKKINEDCSLEPSSLVDYLSNSSLFIFNDGQIKASYAKLQEDMFQYRVDKGFDSNHKFMFDMNDIKPQQVYKIDTLNTYNSEKYIAYSCQNVPNFDSNMEKLKKYCIDNLKNNTIIFVLKSKKQIDEISELFSDAVYIKSEDPILNRINILKGVVNKGFIFNNYIVISQFDIDNVKPRDIKYKTNYKIGQKIKSFDDLSVGDYVVHESYGIGIYNGLKTLKTKEYIKDYIQLTYQDGDKVYVPVDGFDRLYKYASSDLAKPKLNKLNSPTWEKKKLETRKKIHDISKELLDLYLSRAKIKTVPYKSFEEEMRFAFSFPYTLTVDQERAIKDIDNDLSLDYPMDRLLCGDVGYGKTEVAFRAMFKTVLNGFQVAYLCPTTILSKQQYTSALERFKEFPINIELLNRYVTTKKVNEILKKVELGKIDILIGTHKLLNDKIKFKNLGLLVIDEEQRFGVTHKEKIKKIKDDVNVLTLSATPIPRTLKMAMSGLRSLSILDTPPVNRYPIQTYVIEENDLIIRDAIYKEITRNGQVYILINNIEEMPSYEKKINSLVPEAKVICAHGKQDSQIINSTMEDFIEHKYDILICTTIIETGIDISNVNTIIIIDADRFGLSQLYQIRGRVGRSDKIAYAFLMYNPKKVLNEIAEKRLNSIKEFTALGSGYKIAMRDLAIRGAGDLLGSEQAGFIDSVGIDLYTKMVNEEVERIKTGTPITEEKETKNAFEVSNHIADEYVNDESIKIEIHKMISSIKTKDDYQKVKKELIDRFGQVDEEIEVYMLKKIVDNLIEELDLLVTKTDRDISIILNEKLSNKINGEILFLQTYNINPNIKISYRNKKIVLIMRTFNLPKNYMYYVYQIIDVLYSQVI